MAEGWAGRHSADWRDAALADCRSAWHKDDMPCPCGRTPDAPKPAASAAAGIYLARCSACGGFAQGGWKVLDVGQAASPAPGYARGGVGWEPGAPAPRQAISDLADRFMEVGDGLHAVGEPLTLPWIAPGAAGAGDGPELDSDGWPTRDD